MTDMTVTSSTSFPLRPALLALIQRHGRWRVMRAALLTRSHPRADARMINDHLRRDIGLPPAGSVAPSLRHLPF